MSLQKMISTYVNFNCDSETWGMLNAMYRHGLISYSNWSEFFGITRGWYLDEEADCIKDSEKDDKVIFNRDEFMYWKKVA